MSNENNNGLALCGELDNLFQDFSSDDESTIAGGTYYKRKGHKPYKGYKPYKAYKTWYGKIKKYLGKLKYGKYGKYY